VLAAEQKRRQFAASLTCCLLLAVGQAGAVCISSDEQLAERASRDLESFVAERFAAADFDCATRAVELQSQSRALRKGPDGVDARFALRNLALQVNHNAAYPWDKRIALVKAAISNPAASAATGDEDERRFNVLMLLKAGEQYVVQKENGARLQALILAVELELRSPEAARVIRPWVVQTLVPDTTQTHRYLHELAVLAEITSGDHGMAAFRSELARTVHFHASGWRQGDPPSEIAARAGLLLRLAEALEDVRQCYGCVPEWHWKLVMRAGSAYYRIGMQAEGVNSIRRALEMARAIKRPDYRLSEYRFVLVELLVTKYDRREILSFISEMKALADSLDGPIAKEVRESLPQTMKTWGLDKPQ
jgi:hypothetical protein